MDSYVHGGGGGVDICVHAMDLAVDRNEQLLLLLLLLVLFLLFFLSVLFLSISLSSVNHVYRHLSCRLMYENKLIREKLVLIMVQTSQRRQS